MKLDQAFNQLAIVQDFVPLGSSNRPGTKLNVRAITIHNTDNAGKGAGAAAHAKYQKGADARKRKVSWHYTVDDKAVYQSLPLTEVGWHAGSSAGNGSSIGVEICMNSDLDEPAAYERAALLVAVLAHQHALAVPADIVQHNHWSGKNCPRILRERPGAWKAFLKRIGELHAALKAPSAITITASHHDDPPAKSVKSAAAVESDAALVPAKKPAPFAAFAPGITNLHWLVVTRHPEAMVVSRNTKAGKLVGRAGRRFLADRSNGARYHVGIDIFCYEGDEVIAIADGKIVSFYPFYKRPTTGEETYALFVAHDGVVCNYGEVKANSAQAYNWKIGDTVTAGQKIARVSGTNMIHFETYVPGTRTNARWMQNGSARPASLLNPTSLLLDLATRGIRIGIDGSASAEIASPPAAKKTEAKAAQPSSYTGPLPGSADWHSKNGGIPWRFDERGVYTRTAGGERLWRTDGEPVTCRDIFTRFGEEILRAAAKHKVNPAIIMMTIATETAFARKQGFTGPKTFRWEPHVLNKDVPTSFKGSYSAGPMQTLATTVRDTIVKQGSKYGLAYKPFDVAPAIKSKPSPAPAKHPLFDAATSIDLGAAEIRRFLGKTVSDPILVAAVYNAGGIYESGENPWHLRSHDDHLDRAAAWYGDSCTVLSEIGII